MATTTGPPTASRPRHRCARNTRSRSRSAPATTTGSPASTCRRCAGSTSRTRARSPGSRCARSPGRRKEDVDKALDAAHAAAVSWNHTTAAYRARHPQQDRRPARGEPRDARRHRDGRQRQADPRDAERRPPAGDRSLPLLRRRAPRAGGRDLGDRRRHDRLPLPRAARRRRPDHPVELPAADGDVEARAGARRRELRRPQAGRADAGVDHGVHGADRRHPAAAAS